MISKIQMCNDKAQLTGMALKILILDRLPVKVLEQMITAALTGKSDQEIVDIISKAGRMGKKYKEATTNLGSNILRAADKPKGKF